MAQDRHPQTLMAAPSDSRDAGGALTLCALETRYGRPEVRRLFDDEHRLQVQLQIESGLAAVQASHGLIPKEAAAAIAGAVREGRVSVARVQAIEAETAHETMAVVRALAEQSGPGGAYVHLGATSADIVDTAAALQLKEFLALLRNQVVSLRGALLEQAQRHRSTIMLGRTHGQAALPITFGMKMAVYALEVDRHLSRLDEIAPRVCVGKLSGAVGTGAGFGPKAFELQRELMAQLGLAAEEGPTQVVGRDRYVELFGLFSQLAVTVEKVATEIRNLQRTEIDEVREAFDTARQVGSSTMAHKRNPIRAENLCGLARVLRAFATPIEESALLWHERDLSNSSAERVALPHACVLADDIVGRLGKLIQSLEVDATRMEANLRAAGSQIMAEAVMLALVAKGLGRPEAYALVRKCSLEAIGAGRAFAEELRRTPEVSSCLSSKELEAALDPRGYLGNAEAIVDQAAARARAHP